MAITIQKSRLTVKTTGLNEADAPVGVEEPASETAAPRGRVLTSRVAAAPAPSYTVYGILGLIAFLLMAGLVTIQSLELDYYFNKPPPVFTARDALPAVAPTPAPEPAAPAATEAQPATEGQ